MNKLKLSFATACRAVMNAFLVIVLVTLASLIGVGGAALWIYGRPMTAQAAVKTGTVLTASDEHVFPVLTPVQLDSDSPAQLTPARYVPTESEIATISDSPRYTYVSYNGGRQQAHLRVNTVLSTSVPAPLAPSAASGDEVPASPQQEDDHTRLSDPASHYITNAEGRVIGIDGTAGIVAESETQDAVVPVAASVQSKGYEPEVRVAAPVVVRKATPVDEENADAQPGTFNVQAELSSEDERLAQRAQPVTRTTRAARPAMFGANDNFRSFGGY